MRFIDEARIRVAAGHGGRGCVSFRRESYAPRGGPNGGNGGRGGDIIFVADAQLSTLQDFRFRRGYQAENGRGGSGSLKTGLDGAPCVIPVPVGTLIKKDPSGEVLCDFFEAGQTWVACRGGRGGKGNAHFKTATHQAPRFAQPGEEGEALDLVLELKLLADVGLLGFPNAGKSTLLKALTGAFPKIADYPFTTLVPQLGVVFLSDHQTFVLADVPGLIQGAHQGLGLGHHFLKHLERTFFLLHVVDASVLADGALSTDQKKAILKEQYLGVRKELELFNAEFIQKPEWVLLNKWDLVGDLPASRHIVEELRQEQGWQSPVWCVSGATQQGLPALMQAVGIELKRRQPQSHAGPILLPDSPLLLRRPEKPKGV